MLKDNKDKDKDNDDDDDNNNELIWSERKSDTMVEGRVVEELGGTGLIHVWSTPSSPLSIDR